MKLGCRVSVRRSLLRVGSVLALLLATAAPSFADDPTVTALSLADNGAGRVTGANGAIDCTFVPNNAFGTGACETQVPANSMVTLTATPDAQSAFLGWWGLFACPPPAPGAPPLSTPCQYSTETTITVPIDVSTAIAARFQRKTLTLLSLSDNGGGRVIASPGNFDCTFAPSTVNGTGTCSGELPTNTVVTLTASPDTLSSFVGWYGVFACPPQPPGSPPTLIPCLVSTNPTITLPMDMHRTVGAGFQRKSLTLLSLQENGGGRVIGSPGNFDCTFVPNTQNGTGTCSGQRPTGSSVTLTATPDALSSFRGWYAIFACPTPPPGSPQPTVPCLYSTEPTITLTMDMDRTVGASFQRTTLTLLSLIDNGGGSVIASPGDFDCTFVPNTLDGTGTCVAQLPTDTVVTLTATSDPLSKFLGWYAACPPPPPGSPPSFLPCLFSTDLTVTVTMDATKFVAARFQRKTLTIAELIDNGGGRITGSPGGFDCTLVPNTLDGTGTCSAQRPTGSSVTLTAAPDTLSSFRGWYAACPPPPPGTPPSFLPCLLSTDPTLTVTLDADKSVFARFQRVKLQTLAIGDSGAGSVTAAPGAINCAFAPGQINGTGVCSAEMPIDTVATLEAQPVGAAAFLGWYATSACPVPPPPLSPPTFPCLFNTAQTITLTMDVSKTVYARFATKPVADAGDDVSAAEASLVTLDGSGSVDPEGDPLQFTWNQVAGPTVVLDVSDPARPRLVTPEVGPGTTVLSFELTVSDGTHTSDPDLVNVTVTNVNHPPVASASASAAVSETSPVTLDGSLSFDPDSDPLTYYWVQTAGPVVSLTGADTVRPSFTAPLVSPAGDTLTFELTVSDGNASATDDVSVFVENVNHAPQANAGADQVVQVGSSVQLAGVASDPDGDTLTIGWTQTSGQPVVLSAPTTLSPTFTAPPVASGSETLTFQLGVTDSSGATALDTVSVRVQHSSDPPVCSAARPSQLVLWPPNQQLVPIEILGITHRPDNPVTIVITSVTQDEKVEGLADGNTSPDAVIQAGRVLLRAQRAGNGNGRVYQVRFDAVDATGASCSGVVHVGVPLNMKPGLRIVDDGQVYRSTQP